MPSPVLRRPLFVILISVAAIIGHGQVPAFAQESRSATLAVELSRVMTEQQLSAAASKDTLDEDRFVAALAFPGQLLVVSARYSAPLIVQEKIADGKFQEVYLDLNTAPIAGTKIQITDVGANGLLAEDETVDVINRETGMFLLDGNPGGQNMSRDEYQDAVSELDGEYARILQALIDGVR